MAHQHHGIISISMKIKRVEKKTSAKKHGVK